jgi:hypothetical protein
MMRVRLIAMGFAGVVVAGSVLGCGSDPAGFAAPESTAVVPAALTRDVVLAVEGMT